MDKTREETIIKYVAKNFDFLFNLGFKIGTIEQTGKMSSWKIKLASKEFVILLICDKGEWFLTISPAQEECWIGLDVIIFFITDEKELIPSFDGDFFLEEDRQFLRLSKNLEKYLKDIKVIFEKDFYLHKDKMIILRKKVNDLQLKRFMEKN